ncbi:hypothetical protein [Calycomorphotria hydatis]|uniref:Glycosyltransferase RgtA/B/C/D-like domain-containing protein n=1 Tax=Calycomorphotria hydatis TaxID=2528027 RepID=A0A517TEE7_9PLAN|nr:hypothetical protein [Calycomorphotria hydatis]QDT66743.1 hypothetical protein V22_40140 [Calycomorphotria hydatis]
MTRLGPCSYFAIALVAVPIALHLATITWHSVNIPFWDDFDSILLFVLPETNHVQTLFEQHNEHRIAWTRSVAWTYTFLKGEVEFSHLSILGGLGLTGLLLAFLKLYSDKRLPIILFAPAAFIALHPISYGRLLWAMAALQNYFVLLFAFLSYYFWGRRDRASCFFALFFGVMASFTSANGILCFLPLLLWSLTESISKQQLQLPLPKLLASKSTIRFYALSITVLVVGILYFSDYERPMHHPKILDTVGKPRLLLEYFFLLLGGYITIFFKSLDFGIPHKSAGFIVGIATAIAFIFISIKRYDRRCPELYYFFVYMLLTLMTISLARAGLGRNSATEWRYVMYSLIAVTVLYLSLIDIYAEKLLRFRLATGALIFFSFVFNIMFYQYGLSAISSENTRRTEGLRVYLETGTVPKLLFPSSQFATQTIDHAIELEIYSPPVSD